MGYLNNTVVTVDAILTDTGRQLLAQQDGQFRIADERFDGRRDFSVLHAFGERNPIGIIWSCHFWRRLAVGTGLQQQRSETKGKKAKQA